MRYNKEAYSIEVALLKKRPLPQWYLDEPDEHPGDSIYMVAFSDLDTCRPGGFSLGRIPWHRIMAYGLHLGLDEVMMPAFVQIIRAMDNAYVKWHEDNKPPPAGSNQDRPRDPRTDG